ncbi:hypothetical protein KYY02_05250 [Streptomyces pimonensis]|uniref:Secreted protein n=1 Tax=Streptomyces pimonensis TaxID=2860288 RepID=A0ABV4IU67_9ACTN
MLPALLVVAAASAVTRAWEALAMYAEPRITPRLTTETESAPVGAVCRVEAAAYAAAGSSDRQGAAEWSWTTGRSRGPPPARGCGTFGAVAPVADAGRAGVRSRQRRDAAALRDEADDVLRLYRPQRLRSVGEWYEASPRSPTRKSWTPCGNRTRPGRLLADGGQQVRDQRVRVVPPCSGDVRAAATMLVCGLADPRMRIGSEVCAQRPAR